MAPSQFALLALSVSTFQLCCTSSAAATTQKPTKRPSIKPKSTIRPSSASTKEGCSLVTFGTLGTFPFCESSIIGLGGWYYEGVQPNSYGYIEEADGSNGFNNFITPVPSLKASGSNIRLNTVLYFTCADTSVITQDVHAGPYRSYKSATIASSEAPELCAALAIKAKEHVSAAPSTLIKTCVTINVPYFGTRFPVCDVFINPDYSYKCLGTTGIGLGYGGSYVGYPCQYTIMEQDWGFTEGVDYNYISASAGDYYLTDSVFITCGSTSGEIHSYRLIIPYSEAPALCSALARNAKPSSRPTRKPYLRSSARPTKRPSSKPRPTKRPSSKPRPTKRPSSKPRSAAPSKKKPTVRY